MTKTMRKCLLTGAKLAVAAGLLVWVFRAVDWREFACTLTGASLPLLLCALAGYVVSLVIIAFRLRLLLRTQDIEIGLWELVRLTFLGQFFNAVVPGVVGGDLVKAYYATKHTDRKGAALVTVFVDRLLGLTELALLAVAMLAGLWLAGRGDLETLGRPAIAAGAAVLAVTVMLVFLFSPSVRRLLGLQKIYSRLPIAHHIASAGQAARRFRQRPWDLVKAIGITLGAHGTWIAGIALAGASLSLDVPWYRYFLYVPLIYIIGAVPVTPGGAGLVEAFYVVFFASAQIGEGQILALALVARVLDILRGLPGLVVVLTGPKLPKRELLQAELAADPPADARLGPQEAS